VIFEGQGPEKGTFLFCWVNIEKAFSIEMVILQAQWTGTPACILLGWLLLNGIKTNNQRREHGVCGRGVNMWKQMLWNRPCYLYRILKSPVLSLITRRHPPTTNLLLALSHTLPLFPSTNSFHLVPSFAYLSLSTGKGWETGRQTGVRSLKRLLHFLHPHN
jgi:hypothetical protein